MTKKQIRILLGVLYAVLAFNAFGGGIYGMLGAKNVPVQWLSGSMFSSYFVPSLILFIVIGLGCLLTSIALLRNWPIARFLSFTSAFILLFWIVIQLFIIGYVASLQIIIFLLAFLLIWLSRLLPIIKT